ncbi:MAG: VWA domain-containing protein [Acidimicrobiia bacterium]
MTVPVTVDRLTLLGRRLRGAGLTVTAETIADMARALDVVGYDSPGDAYLALRSVVCRDPSEYPTFDRIVRDFLGLVPDAPPDDRRVSVTASSVLAPLGSDETPEEVEEVDLAVGASATERLAHRDFAALDPAEAEAVKALIAAMAWRPPDRRTRRRRPDRRGDRPDLRRSLRAATGPEGDLMPLSMTSRTVRRRPVVVLADISGSMERYAEMFLVFAHAARHVFGGLEAFVFSTRLTRITRQLERRDASRALAEVGATVDDWSGGTRIGDALATFNKDWSRRVCRGGPVAIVLSDGWDCGDPEVLRREMGRLARSVSTVVWLNPLAGRPGYAPETRGMRAVLPFVDEFLPAATVADLRELVGLLESLEARR